jgi:archaeosine-15-forming tRNA-guanine transglycosylase
MRDGFPASDSISWRSSTQFSFCGLLTHYVLYVFRIFDYSFSRETQQRFKKEMIKAAQSNDGSVKVDKLNEILINIGRRDQILSEAEMRQLLHEAGGATETRSIQASAMMQLL